jgi:hypothetical protein
MSLHAERVREAVRAMLLVDAAGSVRAIAPPRLMSFQDTFALCMLLPVVVLGLVILIGIGGYLARRAAEHAMHLARRAARRTLRYGRRGTRAQRRGAVPARPRASIPRVSHA